MYVLAHEAMVHHGASLLIRNVFEQQCKDVIVDSILAKKIVQYQVAFVNKNDEHVKFFGGHLTGVQVVRFTDSDRLVWFDEILHVDEQTLQDALYKLPTVHRDHQVASDAMNLSCIWLTHLLANAHNIPEGLKRDAMLSVMLVMQYKFLTSRLYRHFIYPADKSVAEATYASLSMKFDLKQAGSWGAYLHKRAEDILDEKAPRYKQFEKMGDDREIEKIVNDIQTRLRKTLRLIAGMHYQINASGKRIVAVSQTVEHDGKEILKDKTKSLANYTRYLQSIIPDKSSFLREELLTVVEGMVQTMPPSLFRGTLEWLSENFQGHQAHKLQDLTKEIMVHCFDYLSHNTDSLQNPHDLPGLLARLRGVYTAARSTDPILMDIRQRTENLVKEATGTRNVSLLPPIRTGVLLYIVLRSLAKRHYADT
jgi:hypothetical protein